MLLMPRLLPSRLEGMGPKVIISLDLLEPVALSSLRSISWY
jgi:hypothetical protein